MALAAVLVLALLAGSARYSHAGSSWPAGAVLGGFGLGMVFGHALAHPHYVVVPPPPPPPVYYYYPYPYPYPAYPYYGYPRLHGPVYHRHYGYPYGRH
jgi:hypothetical protein